ncbi:MlaD family protein [Acidiferrimicrobium sp. IK]|uniref:MlaD family protein n=1 Tax=Acidiferrimicrobium sp. IK TaxID=2871700 RepID=UPI0021CB3030|nr:MlaD family protein [Acidiferrimicrobium sp. IK]MCU4184404.1 MlaD family protein [Acidiferrimicrobium sp. IK]
MSVLSRQNRGQLLSIVVLAAVIALLAAFATGSLGGSSGHTIVAQFADAQSITKGNTVHIDGVTAGTVQSITLKKNTAYLKLHIDSGFWPIHTDATATVRPISLLGENYVDLHPGSPSAPVMANGATITTAHTSNAVNFQSVLDALNDPTSTAFGVLLTSLGQGMAGQGGNAADALKALSPALDNTTALTNLLDQQNKTLTALLDNLSPVTAALATHQGQTLDHLVSTANTTLDATAAQASSLGKDLQVLPAFLGSTTTAFDQLGTLSDQATPALQSLRPLTDNLSAVSDELNNFATAAAPAITSLQPVLPAAQSLLQQTGPVVNTLQTSAASGLSDSQALIPLVQQGITGGCSATDCPGLDNLFAFVKNWSLATQNYDGLSHYFRFFGDFNLGTLATLPGTATTAPATPTVSVPSVAAAGVPAANPATSVVNGVTRGVGNLLGGLLGGQSSPTTTTPTTAANSQSATGLSSGQESNLFGYLLGGS